MIPGISRQTQDFFKVINKKRGLGPLKIFACVRRFYINVSSTKFNMNKNVAAQRIG